MVKELADLFRMDQFRERFTEMEGFGEKSFENLLKSAEKARHTTPDRLLYSLGIPRHRKSQRQDDMPGLRQQVEKDTGTFL